MDFPVALTLSCKSSSIFSGVSLAMIRVVQSCVSGGVVSIERAVQCCSILTIVYIIEILIGLFDL